VAGCIIVWTKPPANAPAYRPLVRTKPAKLSKPRETRSGCLQEKDAASTPHLLFCICSVIVRKSGRMLPGMAQMLHDFIQPDSMPYLGKKKWTINAHRARIAVHDA
jgi:hypothetical protein